MKFPDYLEPLVGWRGWGIDEEGGLRGAARSELWMPREPARAVCANAGNKFFQSYAVRENFQNKHLSEGAPQQKCTCGFYAYKTLQGELKRVLESFRDPSTRMEYVHLSLGQVNMWGRVIVHERGYRSQFAYPKAIIVSEEIGHRRIDIIKKEYLIEVQVVPNIQQFLREMINSVHT